MRNLADKFSDYICSQKLRITDDIKFLVILAAIVLFMYLTGLGCPIKTVTGISCAGCGMSRALLCLIQGRFRMAAYYHPLCFLMPFAGIFFIFRGIIPRRISKPLLGIFIFVFMAVYIYRITHGDPVVTFEPSKGLLAVIIKEVFNVLQ